MTVNRVGICLGMAALACFGCPPSFVEGQGPEVRKDLVVNGKSAPGAVLQIQGRSCVDLQILAQMTGATLNILPDQITLTLPASSVEAAPSEPPTGISREFAKAGISQLAEMREWKGAIAAVIRRPSGGTWLAPFLEEYRSHSEEAMAHASVAATSASDGEVLQLLKNQLANLQNWDSKTQATIQSFNGALTVSPSAQQNDPLFLKISDCSTFLSAMIVGRVYADNASCH